MKFERNWKDDCRAHRPVNSTMSKLGQFLTRLVGRSAHGNAVFLFSFMAPGDGFRDRDGGRLRPLRRSKARLNMVADRSGFVGGLHGRRCSRPRPKRRRWPRPSLLVKRPQYSQFTLGANQPTVTISYDAANLIRTATVTYSGTYSTIFARVLGASTLSVSGNFGRAICEHDGAEHELHVFLDNSGSMALPATQAGITQMQSLTTAQMSGGCALRVMRRPQTIPRRD